MKILTRSLACLSLALASAITHAAAVSTHPRLWMTQSDVSRLRQWAVSTNPVWQQGLRQMAASAAAEMDSGTVPNADNGGSTYSPYNTEAYAALFAFMANVDPDATARGDWANRARTLLFYILDRVDTCMRSNPPTAAGPFCSAAFPVSDRSRWQGAAFPLAVDWLYGASLPNGQPALSAADKAKIRRVFIWWSYLDMEAYPNPYNNPPEYSLPVGTVGDPLLRLTDDTRHHRLRYSGNNYFAGHMRQLGMMAIALDAVDDVLDPLAPAYYLKINSSGNLQQYPFNDANGRLGGFLHHAVDGWQYMQDYLLRHDGRGGMPAEGMEYAPTSIGIPAQFLMALETSGYGDLEAQSQHGPLIAGLSTNPFYRALLPGYLHSLSPVPANNPNRGWVYLPAWYGDGEFYYQGDSMNILGPLALHAARVGDTLTVDTIRWVQRNIPPGGNSTFLERARGKEDILESLMYFLVYDPNAASSAANAPDPRPQYPTSFWSEGLGRLLSRSDWSGDARWFNFKLSWDSVDHQHGDGLMFELYRRGEWLTKGALGYGLEGGATDYKNSLSVQNTLWPSENPESFLARMLRRGSQMPQNRQAADPQVLYRSESQAYSYVTGDATNLYNAWYEPGDQTPLASRASDVAHVSRSIVWLKPEHVIVYDRARTQTAARFKRFWLNMPDRLPGTPQINGNVVTGTTPGGQHLFVTSVLPASKTLSIVTTDAEINPTRGNLWSLGDEDPILQHRQYVDPGTGQPVPGQYENYATRLRIDATGGPSNVRFLSVVQGADATAVRDAATLVQSVVFGGCATAAAGFEGASVGTHLVLFRNDLATTTQCLEYLTAATVSDHVLSGLTPWGGYSVTRTLEAGNQRLRVVEGGTIRADGGGVLRFDPAALPAPSARLVADADALDFAVVALGTQQQRSVALSNRGSAPLVIASTTLAGPAAADYSLSGSCVGSAVTLAPDSTCSLDVTFRPSGPTFRQAAITIDSNSTASFAPIGLAGVGEAGDRIFLGDFE